MSAKFQQTKEREIVYLYFFLIRMRLPRTPRQAQAVLAISGPAWNITPEDIAAMWPRPARIQEAG
jgi:hypothetical protein